jgi:hypothetical protein
MTIPIETEFRGYTIRYAENEDVWRCHQLDMDGSTLTQLKDKIGRYLARIARAAEVTPAFHYVYGGRFEPCFIVSVSNTLNYKKQPEVWTYTEREEVWRGSTRTVKDRKRFDADSMILDTPENRLLIDEAERLRALADAADKAAKEAARIIPRVDVSTLRLEPDDPA